MVSPGILHDSRSSERSHRSTMFFSNNTCQVFDIVAEVLHFTNMISSSCLRTSKTIAISIACHTYTCKWCKMAAKSTTEVTSRLICILLKYLSLYATCPLRLSYTSAKLLSRTRIIRRTICDFATYGSVLCGCF